MRVKLTTWRTGRGICNRPGDVIDVSAEEASLLLARGNADPVVDRPGTLETASPPAATVPVAARDSAAFEPPHTAALARPRPRKSRS